MKKSKTALASLLDNIGNTNLDDFDNFETDIKKESSQEKKTSTIFSEIKAKEKPGIKSEKTVIYVDPDLCEPWVGANRPEDEFGNIDELADSIKKFGQKVPALIRPKKGSENRYELIYGNRRRRACLKANEKLMAILEELSDIEASINQQEENEKRKNISDMATAQNWKLQIQLGIYATEKELGQALGIAPQTLNDIMSFTRIPQELSQSIKNFKDISRKTAVKIATLSKDKKKLDILIKLADKISEKKIHAGNIDRCIEKISTGKPDSIEENIFYKDKFISIKSKRSGQHIITIDKLKLEKDKLEEIRDFMVRILKGYN